MSFGLNKFLKAIFPRSLFYRSLIIVDVLQDPDIREGVKVFSNWPTVPQLYVNGDFVGGADIMREMYESGELSKIIPKI